MDKVTKNIKISTVRLEQVIDIHQHVKKLNLECPLPSYQTFLTSDFPSESLMSILKLNPIIVRQSGNHYYCVGNIRMYELSTQILSPSIQVPVSYLSSRKLIEIEKLFWAERMLAPIIYDIGPKRTARLSQLWDYFRAHQPWNKTPFKSITTKIKLTRLLRDYKY